MTFRMPFFGQALAYLKVGVTPDADEGGVVAGAHGMTMTGYWRLLRKSNPHRNEKDPEAEQV